MAAGLVIEVLALVTFGAVNRGNDGGDVKLFGVEKGACFPSVRPVTVSAAYPHPGVGAGKPLLENRRGVVLVAFDAVGAFINQLGRVLVSGGACRAGFCRRDCVPAAAGRRRLRRGLRPFVRGLGAGANSGSEQNRQNNR